MRIFSIKRLIAAPKKRDNCHCKLKYLFKLRLTIENYFFNSIKYDLSKIRIRINFQL